MKTIFYYRVLTVSRSSQIGNGLTYGWEGEALAPGTLVRIPLRKGLTLGIIISDEKPAEKQAYKEIVEVFGQVLPESSISTAKAISRYYGCTLRDAIKPFLPGIQWKKFLVTTQNPPISIPLELHSLTDYQNSALQTIRKSKQPCLLFGATGSGKTELYLHLIAECLKAGKQAIVLLPEIFLSTFLQTRIGEALPKQHIAVIDSNLTEAQKRTLWNKIQAGECLLIIGPRSALFAPCSDLGLIVIDEEHEWTYKSEQTPRYHARTVAQMLAEQTGAKLVLGSATPSLESWHAATKEHRFTLVELPQRFAHDVLPVVHLVDLVPIAKTKQYPFSKLLLEKITERLERHEQTILFINRRGFSTSLLCLRCRRRVVSAVTNLPLSVHHGENGAPVLVDHTTGERSAVPEVCPSCGAAELLGVGAGTQRIETQLKAFFPQAVILRADRDNLSSTQEMQTLLQSMKKREADILLGTQLVTKGLHLPHVTLAAVLVADIGLSLPNFRMSERTFQLLTQLSGRSGRVSPGEVVIQAFRPDASEIKLAAQNDVRGFLEQEAKMRSHFHYPPFVELVRLIYRTADAQKKAQRVCQSLQKTAGERAIVTAAPLYAQPKYWHVLIRGHEVWSLLSTVDTEGAIIDRDPIDVL